MDSDLILHPFSRSKVERDDFRHFLGRASKLQKALLRSDAS